MADARPSEPPDAERTAPQPVERGAPEATRADEEGWLRWREARLRALQAPDGWLTLVGLSFLEDGVWTIGADPSCRVHAAGASEPVIGTLHVTGDRVRLLPGRRADGSAFMPTVEGGAPPVDPPDGEGVALRADDAGGPSIIRDGELSIALIRRNGQLALRLRDNRSPRRRSLRSIPTFPYAPAFVRSGVALAAPKGATIAVTNVTGFVEIQPVAAVLRFSLPAATPDGAESDCSLVATAGANRSLFVVFADATNRDATSPATYPGGRFLTVDPPDASGRVRLDFNRAINPVCALVPFATCPTPPIENRLHQRIEAGERYPPQLTPDTTPDA